MKRYINLLTQRKDYQKKEKFFSRFRRMTTLLGVVTILFLIIVFAIEEKIKKEYQTLLAKKQDFLNQLISKKDVEKQIIYFNEKSNFFNKVLKEDINFLPYYRVLKTYLPVSTQSADISMIKYNNTKKVEFVLTFSNYQDLYNSLSNLENEKFLNLFDELTLNSINLSETKIRNYQLSFRGRFKPLPSD